MHSNAEILTAVITHWVSPMSEAVANSVLGTKLMGVNEWAKKYFPLPVNYNVTQELGFLLRPTVNAMLGPAISRVLQSSGIEDSDIPKYAHELAKSMRNEANEKGVVTVFDTFILSESDIITLQDLLNKNLPITTAGESYQVQI